MTTPNRPLKTKARGASDRPTLVALGCAIATILFWAGSFPAITVALEGFSPLPLAALRFVLASTVLGVVLAFVAVRSPKPHTRPRPTYRDILWFAGCGFLGIALYNWLLNTGQQTVSAAAASFLIACQPVFAALVATRVFGEPFGRKAWSGTALCLAGALVLSLGQPASSFFSGGALLVLMAAVCSGSFFALQRPLSTRFGPLVSAFGVLMFGSFWLSPWIGSGIGELAEASTASVLAFVFLGTLPGALAYVTWMVAIQELGAARAANLLFFMAPTAALMAVPITGVWPDLSTWVGGALALLGVLIVHRSANA